MLSRAHASGTASVNSRTARIRSARKQIQSSALLSKTLNGLLLQSRRPFLQRLPHNSIRLELFQMLVEFQGTHSAQHSRAGHGQILGSIVIALSSRALVWRPSERAELQTAKRKNESRRPLCSMSHRPHALLSISLGTLQDLISVFSSFTANIIMQGDTNGRVRTCACAVSLGSDRWRAPVAGCRRR